MGLESYSVDGFYISDTELSCPATAFAISPVNWNIGLEGLPKTTKSLNK
jgi:hypothetical protein